MNDYKEHKVIIIDNYDSFTYNLVHMVEELMEKEIVVMRNDEIDYELLKSSTHIILSPGPGIPDEAGDLKNIIKRFAGEKKILGVCLGLQAIGEVFGGQLINLDKVFHGVSTYIQLTDVECPIFSGIESNFEAGRYHSWVIALDGFPGELTITAVDDKGEIMAAQHNDCQVYGVQFHPESIMTPEGKTMIKNFLDLQ